MKRRNTPMIVVRHEPKPCPRCYSPMTATDDKDVFVCPRHGAVHVRKGKR